jgi:hypothetical protein
MRGGTSVDDGNAEEDGARHDIACPPRRADSRHKVGTAAKHDRIGVRRDQFGDQAATHGAVGRHFVGLSFDLSWRAQMLIAFFRNRAGEQRQRDDRRVGFCPLEQRH